nr:hypothetical protein [Tanacetum cinerariifolium]
MLPQIGEEIREEFRTGSGSPNTGGNPPPAPSYETRLFLKSSAVKNSYRAPWVPTVNRKFTTGSTRNHTADMGRKGKAVKP